MRKPLLLAMLALLIGSAAMAAVPNKMNVQGRLLDAGVPMNGSHPADFKIYDAATAGSLLWAESSSLIVQGGIFTATLGAITLMPAIVFDNQSCWLEVTVDGATLSPRLLLTTSAYAFWSQRADTADFALNAPAGGDNLWSTDGANVWRSGGKVGVGTSSPNQNLGVNGMVGIYPQPWVQPTTKGTFMFHQNNAGTMYSYDYTIGRGDTLGLAAAAIAFDTYGANGQYSGNKMWLSQEGNLGIGTIHPAMKLDVRTKDTEEPLQWVVDSGPYLGSYVKFINNNARGGIALGNPNPWGGEPADNAAILHTTGGWQWNKQLNIMGNVGINTNNPTAALTVGGDAYVSGNLNVTGYKCRVVTTDFGQLKMNAVESAHALFMDDEPSARLVNGGCRVSLSPKFLATVTVNGKYPLAVNVTFYGRHGGEWYVERDATGFTVIDPSGSNAEFSWQAIARQRDYEDANLDPVDSTTAVK